MNDAIPLRARLFRRGATQAGLLAITVGVAIGAVALMFPNGSPAAQPAGPAPLLIDVDGDGAADSLTVELGFDAATPRAGKITAVSGATGQPLYTVDGAALNDRFGHSVQLASLRATAPAELLVTAPSAAPPGESDALGRIDILSATTGVWSRSITAPAGTRIGLAIDIVADQDADGWGEIITEGAVGGTPWEARSFVFSGRTGALLAVRSATLGGLRRHVEAGGSIYLAADLDDSGAVDAQDIALMAAALASSGGAEFDVNRDGATDSADIAAVADSLLRGDRSIVASGLVTEVEGEAAGMQSRWSGVHGGDELNLAWSQVTHNAATGASELEEPPASNATGGVGEVVPGLAPCECGTSPGGPGEPGEPGNPGNPEAAIGGTPGCSGHMAGCPDRWVPVGTVINLTPPGPNCTFTVTGSAMSHNNYGMLTALHEGCVSVTMTCTTPDGSCCACQTCSICVFDTAPECDTTVAILNFPPPPAGEPVAIDHLGDLVVLAEGTPEYRWVDGVHTPGVYDWSIQLSDCNAPCPSPGTCPDCPDDCPVQYGAHTSQGALRLADYPSFASLTPLDGQCLWVRVRYRHDDCDPDACCDGPLPCCHAVASCKIPLYWRDPTLDSDGDGYCDWEEAGETGMPDDRLVDLDLDGIRRDSDIRGVIEYRPASGSSPPWQPLPYRERFDTDNDGVQDLAELALGLDPVLQFTAPGQPDRYTAAYLAADRDEDLIFDVHEEVTGLDPTVRDTDGDGIIDGIELRSGTDPRRNHRHESPDTDGDGLSDYEEAAFYGTDPNRADTDGDTLSDFFEARAGLNPLSPHSGSKTVLAYPPGGGDPFLRTIPGPHDAHGDTDFDGLSNIMEQAYGTDPTHRDSDGDGTTDENEIDQGSDPINPIDGGLPPAPGEVCWMLVTINGGHHDTGGCDPLPEPGDNEEPDDPRPPGSDSGIGIGVGGMNDEKLTNVWTVTIPIVDLNGDGDTDDPGESREISTGPNGERTTLLMPFRRGRCYDITMRGRRRSWASHDAWFLQFVPVDPNTLDDLRPTICRACCCIEFDRSGGALENGCCFEADEACWDPHGPRPRTARMCLPLIDIDVDSDNNGGTQPPSRSSDEEKAEETSVVGKLVTIHNTDSDGDFVPGYADGYNLNGIAGDEDDRLLSSHAAAAMTPIIFEIKGVSNPEQARVRFQYSGSDPAAVIVTQPPEGGPPHYVLPSGGRTRLWRKPAAEARSISASGGVSDPAGDYIIPSHAYTLADLGIPQGGTLTLWAEAVAPSETLKDIEIELAAVGLCSDTVYATAIGTQYRVVTEENGQMQLGAAVPFPPLSAPSPVIDITDYAVTAVRAAPDYRGLLVDISLSGAVDDAVSDLIRDGAIDRLDVFMNDQRVTIDGVFPGWIPVQTVQKLGAGDPAFVPTSVIGPFDYQGEFSALLSDVPVGPGWNTLKLVATNSRGLPGYAEFAFEVVTEAPPDQELVATFDFHGVAPAEEAAGPPPVLTLAITSNGAGFGPFDLVREAPGRYVLDDLVAEVLNAEDAQLDPDQPDVWLVRITHANSLLYESYAIIVETGDNTGTFAFVSELTEAERMSLVGWTISLGEVRPVLRSDGGIFVPVVAQLVGPVALAMADSFTVSLVVGNSELASYEVNQYGDALLLADSRLDPPAVFVAAPARDESDAVEDQIVRIAPGGRYGAPWVLIGFRDGIADAGVQFWQGSVDLTAALIESSPVWNWIVRWQYGDEVAELQDQKNRRDITAGVEGIQQLAELAPVLLDIVIRVLDGDETVIDAVYNGDHDALNHFDEKHRVAIEIATYIFVDLADEFAAMDSYDKGWLAGRIIGEIGLTLGTPAVAAAGKAAVISVVSAKLSPVLAAMPRFANAAAKLSQLAASASSDVLRLAKRFGHGCENLIALCLKFQRQDDLDVWPAFQRMVAVVRASPGGGKINPTSFLGASFLTFKQLYERATAGATVIRGIVPSYHEWKKVMGGLLHPKKVEWLWLDSHHTAVKDLMKEMGRIAFGRDLTPDEIRSLDRMPALPLFKPWHVTDHRYPNSRRSFHEIYQEVKAANPPPPGDLNARRALLRETYRVFNDEYVGSEFDFRKVGQVADDWIEKWLTDPLERTPPP